MLYRVPMKSDLHLPEQIPAVTADRDRLIIPDHNTNTSTPPQEQHRLDEVVGVRPRSFASTMSSGAGFYSSLWGSVPFVIGPPRPVLFEVWVIR